MEKQNPQACSVRKEKKTTVLGAGTGPELSCSRKKRKYFKNQSLSFQWGQSNCDPEFLGILRCVWIKSVNLSHISHVTLVALTSVSLPISYQRRDEIREDQARIPSHADCLDAR